MKNKYDEKDISNRFYCLYYICMKYNDEQNLYKKDKKEKKAVDCNMYFNGYKFFVEKYINDMNRSV